MCVCMFVLCIDMRNIPYSPAQHVFFFSTNHTGMICIIITIIIIILLYYLFIYYYRFGISRNPSSAQTTVPTVCR